MATSNDSELAESSKIQLNHSRDFLEMSMEEKLLVSTLKQWVLKEAHFYGRTDPDFLLVFLRGCKFDMAKTKKKLTMYYENRKKIPKWWANRDLKDTALLSIADQRLSTVLIDKDPHQPTTMITTLSRFGQSPEIFDNMEKLHSIIVDIAIRRRNCQLNGFIWIVDCKDYPLWLATRFLSPIVLKHFIYGYYMSTPLRIKSACIINSPPVATAVWATAQPFLTPKLRKRIRFFRNGWSSIIGKLPIELIPDEFGGQAGSFKTHEDEFLRELLSYTDYIADDNKYGFQSKK